MNQALKVQGRPRFLEILSALNRSCVLLPFRVSIQQTEDFKKLYGKLNLGSSHWHSGGIVLHTYLYSLPSAVTPGSLTFKERPHHASKKKKKWIKHSQLNCLKSTLYLFCVRSWYKRLKAWIRAVFIVPISFSPNNINKQSTKKGIENYHDNSTRNCLIFYQIILTNSKQMTGEFVCGSKG